jgi:hypothetical protein
MIFGLPILKRYNKEKPWDFSLPTAFCSWFVLFFRANPRQTGTTKNNTKNRICQSDDPPFYIPEDSV